jgi:para-nitrobenzyl esterase
MKDMADSKTKCSVREAGFPTGACSTYESAITDTVKTQNGMVSGIYNKDRAIRKFLGIPYAAPPLGELRWRAPQPPESWSGVRKINRFSNSAMQNLASKSSRKLIHLLLGTKKMDGMIVNYDEPISEDCLYLNIWTGAKSSDERRPVMVYIHGGSFTSGSGSMDWYDGETMANKGIVYVTVNYRLSVLGFMAHPELTKESGYNASGNYGILDLIAALKWVKNNIAEFGGDPENVTIAGESAGSGCVNILMASPLAKGLFHRAIAESGGYFSKESMGTITKTMAEMELAGVAFQKAQNKTSLAEMRQMPAIDLIKAAKKESYIPIIDGYVLPDSVYHIFAAGRQNDVPLIVGNNADEGAMFFAKPLGKAMNAKNYRAAVFKKFEDKAEEFLKLYPLDTNRQAREAQIAVGRDHWFAWQMHTWAKLQSKTGKSKVYYYYFDKLWPIETITRKWGVFHASEIIYAYGNLDKVNLPFSDVDRKLSDIMSDYWTNFAAMGDPNGKELPLWTACDETYEQTMELGNNIGMIDMPRKTYLDFFDAYEDALRLK